MLCVSGHQKHTNIFFSSIIFIYLFLNIYVCDLSPNHNLLSHFKAGKPLPFREQCHHKK